MSVGENIKKRRKALGLSQQVLADALGYKTRSSITKIESGETSLNNDKLFTFANILNTSVEYLLTGNSSQTEHSIDNNLYVESEKFVEKGAKKCISILLAGGKYRVNKLNVPFQFVTVKDKPIVLYTMEVYQRHPLIDDIYVVCLDGWEDLIYNCVENYNISKFRKIIPAGENGIKSVKNAIEWLTPSNSNYDIVILQEATRPLIDLETISNAIYCCKKNGSAIPFTYLEDTTPFLFNKQTQNISHLDAYSLISLQSPELYTLGNLKYSFIEASKTNHELTENNCSVFMHHIGRKLSFCDGNNNNLRIIHENDLKLFEAILNNI